MDASQQTLRGPCRMPSLRAPAARLSRCRCVGVKAIMQRDVSPSNKARSSPVGGGRSSNNNNNNNVDHKSQRSQLAQQLNSLWLKEALVQDDAPARPNTHGVSNGTRAPATTAPPPPSPATSTPPPAAQQRPASAAGSNGSSSSPQPSVASDTILYFAYGANLAFETLSRRGVRIASRDAAVIRDPSVRMRFKHRGGYATLERVLDRSVCKYTPYTNQHVHGVLYKLGSSEFKKLQQFEGGYEVAEFEVETYDGHVTVAKAFVSGPMSLLPQEVTPTEKYMRLLRDGAADNYLHPLYQAWLSSIQTVTSTGLGPEYFNTPSKAVAFSFLLVAALTAAAFYFQ